jgi:hypothetical protein
MPRLLATDEMDAEKDTGFSALPSYLGSIERKEKSNENRTATTFLSS